MLDVLFCLHKHIIIDEKNNGEQCKTVFEWQFYINVLSSICKTYNALLTVAELPTSFISPEWIIRYVFDYTFSY